MIQEWLMKRNCSFTPKKLILFYISLVFFSLVIAISFLALGVWPILVFTLIEIVAVTIGFLIYSRHALDYEKLVIDGKRLIIEKNSGGKLEQCEFNTDWVQLEIDQKTKRLIRFSQADQSLFIGHYVHINQLPNLYRDISRHL